ncbi:alpha/beta fold hydrolase [Geomicrobium sediminis]|uniref:Pimeloyl-ACP methyl ester carboxylesterase n=1 Tax=Geomicrobium sediminis TaxID=1347788 RepID=A0ABS2PGQ3_9BACL|nr:alpha/beta hydrolase [Geomicrobium sediminis]MBM7634613.1 pimeloyl-ACP methyl ester carboxylesterase [Geomicrobium sediminis]
MGHFIETFDQTTLFVEDIGEGTPVIFLHGWPVNHRMFDHQMAVLPEKGYRFIGVDLRGFGKSDKPSSGYTYDALADDLRAVIDELQLDDAVLAGFSMGGAIAIRYMARHEGKGIRKLALLGAAAPVFTERDDFQFGIPKDNVNGLIEGSYEDRAKMLEDFGELFFGHEPSEAYNRWFHSLAMDASPHATIACARTLRDADLRDDLSAIEVPTAILHGKNDEICPFDLAEVMESGIEAAEIVPFNDSGHSLFYDEREKFTEELIRFFEK